MQEQNFLVLQMLGYEKIGRQWKTVEENTFTLFLAPGGFTQILI